MHIIIEPMFVLIVVASIFSMFALIDAIRAPQSMGRRIGYGIATLFSLFCLLAMIFRW